MRPHLLFDDRSFVPAPLQAIVGQRRFGDILKKRQHLVQQVQKICTDMGWGFHRLCCNQDIQDLIEQWQADPLNQPDGLVWHPAQSTIIDPKAYQELLERVQYSKVDLYAQNGCACFSFSANPVRMLERLLQLSASTQAHKITPEAEIPPLDVTPSLMDISDKASLLQFLSASTETRFFNRMKADPMRLTKASSDIQKIQNEYTFYQLLPAEMQRWFVQPTNLTTNNQEASYQMERLNMPDMSIMWLHGTLDQASFSDFLDRVFLFFAERPHKDIAPETYKKARQKLYQDKVSRRFEQLQKLDCYAQLNGLFANGSDYADIADLIDQYHAFYQKHAKEADFRLAIIHGDPCFSNILFDSSSGLLRLIDPKGASTEADLWHDPLYDLAKLSHSVLGNYDFINNRQFRITTDENLRLNLQFADKNDQSLKQLFLDQLTSAGYDPFQVRLAELSLFLSMLPLHADHPEKLLAFMLNAAQIFKELQDNV